MLDLKYSHFFHFFEVIVLFIPFLLLKRVSAVNSADWLDSLTEPPLLQSSPAAQFLSSYFPDGVGLSPTLNIWKSKVEDSTGETSYFLYFTCTFSRDQTRLTNHKI